MHQSQQKGNKLGLFHLSLGGDTALGVSDLDTESLGLLDNLNTLAGRNGVADPVKHVLATDIYRTGARYRSIGAVGTYSAA